MSVQLGSGKMNALRKKSKCSNCKCEGHTIRSCKQPKPIGNSSSSAAVTTRSPEGQKKAKKSKAGTSNEMFVEDEGNGEDIEEDNEAEYLDPFAHIDEEKEVAPVDCQWFQVPDETLLVRENRSHHQVLQDEVPRRPPSHTPGATEEAKSHVLDREEHFLYLFFNELEFGTFVLATRGKAATSVKCTTPASPRSGTSRSSLSMTPPPAT